MDIVTHAVVGAASGAVFGHPIVGAAVAVLADLPIVGPRRAKPNAWYNLTHSLGFALWLTLVFGWTRNLAATISLAALSHIILDAFTHGQIWAPTLCFPFKDRRFSYGEEWEWFNKSWWNGLSIAVAWVMVCIILMNTVL